MGMTRAAMWTSLGLISVVRPIVLSAFERERQEDWRGDASPHGHAWSSSLHGSSFPGHSKGCGRAAVYSMMGIPGSEPFPLEHWATGEMGKDAELRFVRRFAAEGRLLTADQTAGEQFQTGFEVPDLWLTGSPDAIILPSGWTQGHVVEVKHRKDEVVTEMLEGWRGADPKHVAQGSAYIGMARAVNFSPTVMLDSQSRITTNPFDAVTTLRVAPPDDGTLIYVSRDNDLKFASFPLRYDDEFWRAGCEQVAQWRDYFVRGELPPHVNAGRSGPMGWSELPCKWCDFKRDTCKPDYQAKKIALSDSQGIEWAKSLNPEYDYAAIRAATFARWGVVDPLVASPLTVVSS